MSGFDGRGEELVVCRVVLGEAPEALEGDGVRGRGDAVGLEKRVVGESFEDAGDLGIVEDVEELGDGEVVVCCEIGEGEVGAVVVGEEVVEVEGFVRKGGR